MSELKKLLKNRNNRIMLVILIIGIVIIMISAMPRDAESGAELKTVDCSGEEARLGEILSEIKGAGEVSVMISYGETSNETDGIGRGFSYGNNSVSVEPRGVIIVADGADDREVRNSLKAAATAATGVGANRVCVYDRDIKK